MRTIALLVLFSSLVWPRRSRAQDADVARRAGCASSGPRRRGSFTPYKPSGTRARRPQVRERIPAAAVHASDRLLSAARSLHLGRRLRGRARAIGSTTSSVDGARIARRRPRSPGSSIGSSNRQLAAAAACRGPGLCHAPTRATRAFREEDFFGLGPGSHARAIASDFAPDAGAPSAARPGCGRARGCGSAAQLEYLDPDIGRGQRRPVSRPHGHASTEASAPGARAISRGSCASAALPTIDYAQPINARRGGRYTVAAPPLHRHRRRRLHLQPRRRRPAAVRVGLQRAPRARAAGAGIVCRSAPTAPPCRST